MRVRELSTGKGKAEQQPNKYLSFAKRHLLTHFKTFDAESAIWRAKALESDAETFVELDAKFKAAGVEFGYHIHSYEIFNCPAAVPKNERGESSRLTDTHCSACAL